MQTAYWNKILNRSRWHEWLRGCKEARQPTGDDHQSGRITEECNILFGSCQEILTKELGMSRVATKFAPWLITED